MKVKELIALLEKQSQNVDLQIRNEKEDFFIYSIENGVNPVTGKIEYVYLNIE